MTFEKIIIHLMSWKKSRIYSVQNSVQLSFLIILEKAIIYNIDASGGIISKNLIPTKNTERVSLTGDKQFL